MAKKNVTADATETGIALTATSERMGLALEATLKLHGLFEGLITNAAPLSDTGHLEEAAVIEAIAIRGRQVLSVAMAMLGDDLESVEDARRVLSDSGSKKRKRGGTI